MFKKTKKLVYTSIVEKGMKHILWFRDIRITDISLVGGKNASLGEMYSELKEKGVPVPNGFAVTAKLYRDFLVANKLNKKIKEILKGLDVTDVQQLAKVGKHLRSMILQASFSADMKKEISLAYEQLKKEEKQKILAVAVRSSATAEDLPDASFAGQQETYLNVRGCADVLIAVKKCIASLFTDRAISYREAHGFDHLSVDLSVGVQMMVRSDKGASGVMFTLDTESGFRGVVLINASYGLGEYVVKGRVTPDQFYVFKDGLTRGKDAVISHTLGSKKVKLVYGKTTATKQVRVNRLYRERFSITDKEILQLAKWGMQIESHYGKPQDIEWAKDGQTGKLYIVQARPETVKFRVNHAVVEQYKLKNDENPLLTGTAVGQKIGAGKVHIIETPSQMKQFKKGEVLVTRITDPDWEPIMRIASAIVTEEGGKTSHAAIVSREIGVPCVVGVHDARKKLKNGQPITVSCAQGDNGIIYKNILPFEVKRTKISDVPKTKTQVMMNVGDPGHAFGLSFLPHDGIGLARLEFIFTNFVRIHPLALVNYAKLKDKKAKKQISKMTKGYKKKENYCIDRLAEGIARIATASYPKKVIVRMSDFKTNEYAKLIGGEEFELHESNPMLGFRGASRYYSKEYKPGFALECAAIKKVREEWGLDNVVVMIPFCRTPDEGEKVLKTMAEFGLKRGENNLQVYAMCEIPSNVILVEEFMKIFDGFSIGSNDLTQLTLGLDRDSAKISYMYDANDVAVKRMIQHVIQVAHKRKKYIGICGQAPSDSPEFTDFLVKAGIDSISLNPDSVVETRKRIAYVEKTVGKTGKKTNTKFLSFVVVLGVIGAGLIGLGAGCASNITGSTPNLVSQNYMSPATVRQHMQDNLEREQKITDAKRTATLNEQSFATFKIKYPIDWSVTNWNGGVTLTNASGTAHISIYSEIVAPSIPTTTKKTTVTVDGLPAVRYDNISVVSSTATTTFIQLSVSPTTTLDIDSNSADLDVMLQTFHLTHDSGVMNTRPLNHWDIQDGRICADIITYAKRDTNGTCKAFSRPCDVPNSWTVCTTLHAN